ncbi:MAG: PilZ domain-containing protein [Thiotrichales bacterium]|nr:PilZ domain-containing protein [Thiotrichales bacterium]
MKNDKRLFYRIDVMMPCSFRIVSHETLDTDVLPSHPDSKYIEDYFMKDLNELDDQISEVISQINVKSSLLASALSAMNSKLNFMMQTIDADQLTRAIPQRLVNLSGGGISFVVNEHVDTRNKMDLLIHPISSEKPILVRCDIISSAALSKDDDAYRVSLQFQSLPEEDRRKLVYFIQAKEIEQANQARSTES